MSVKKALCVIVEGPSDESALGLILNELFDSASVFIEIVYGDITSERGIRPNNIKKNVGDRVNKVKDQYGLKNSDFIGIIHCMDLDGTYVEPSCIIEETDVKTNREYPYYTLESIITTNKENIVDRNKRKAANMSCLSGLTRLSGIPYYPLYFSSNLDHALFNKLNLFDEEKEILSNDFADKYSENLSDFKVFICSEEFAQIQGMKESWNFIKAGNHSLQRYTNFGLIFTIFKEYISKDINGDKNIS